MEEWEKDWDKLQEEIDFVGYNYGTPTVTKDPYKAMKKFIKNLLKEKEHKTDGSPCWCNPIVEDYTKHKKDKCLCCDGKVLYEYKMK